MGSKRDRQENASDAPYISTPMCGCGAGPTNVMKDLQGRIYFTCPDDVSKMTVQAAASCKHSVQAPHPALRSDPALATACVLSV